MKESLKTPYPADGEIWSALIYAVAEEIRELEGVRQDVLAAKFVSTAEGEQLDRLASIFDVERQTGEPNEKYRLRVQTALRSQLSSATVAEIRETVAVLLNAEISDVLVQEQFDADAPQLSIGVWNSQLEDQNLTVDEFFTEAEPLTAAGVGVDGFARGTFQFTSESEPVASDKGFAQLNADNTGPVEGTGGTWSELLRSNN